MRTRSNRGTTVLQRMYDASKKWELRELGRSDMGYEEILEVLGPEMKARQYVSRADMALEVSRITIKRINTAYRLLTRRKK